MGITLPQAGQQATRENVVRMAQNAEKEGFDSLWVFERLLWPINPQTPYPGTPDGSPLSLASYEYILVKMIRKNHIQLMRFIMLLKAMALSK